MKATGKPNKTMWVQPKINQRYKSANTNTRIKTEPSNVPTSKNTILEAKNTNNLIDNIKKKLHKRVSPNQKTTKSTGTGIITSSSKKKVAAKSFLNEPPSGSPFKKKLHKRNKSSLNLYKENAFSTSNRGAIKDNINNKRRLKHNYTRTECAENELFTNPNNNYNNNNDVFINNNSLSNLHSNLISLNSNNLNYYYNFNVGGLQNKAGGEMRGNAAGEKNYSVEKNQQKRQPLLCSFSSFIVTENDINELENRFDEFLNEENKRLLRGQKKQKLEQTFQTEYLERLLDLLDDIGKDKRFCSLFNKLSISLGLVVNVFVEQIMHFKEIIENQNEKIKEFDKVKDDKSRLESEFLKMLKDKEQLQNYTSFLTNFISKENSKVNLEAAFLENKKLNEVLQKQKNFIQENLKKEEKMMKLLYAIGRSGINIEQIFKDQVLTPSENLSAASRESFNKMSSQYSFKQKDNPKTILYTEYSGRKSSDDENLDNLHIIESERSSSKNPLGNSSVFAKKKESDNVYIDNFFNEEKETHREEEQLVECLPGGKELIYLKEESMSEFSDDLLVLDEEKEIQRLKDQGLLKGVNTDKVEDSKNNVKPGFKLQLGALNEGKNKEIKNFHDEVLSKINEFSKSWRDKMMEEKTFNF